MERGKEKQEEIVVAVEKYIDSLPLLPEWSTYLKAWLKKMTLREEKPRTYKLYLTAENFVEFEQGYFVQRDGLVYLIDFCEQLRKTEESPPTNLAISLLFKIAESVAKKSLSEPIHCEYFSVRLTNHVYILPQHFIQSIYCVYGKSVEPSKWISCNVIGHVIRDGKIPLDHYVYLLLNLLCKEQMKIALSMFFPGQPALNKQLLKFLRKIAIDYKCWGSSALVWFSHEIKFDLDFCTEEKRLDDFIRENLLTNKLHHDLWNEEPDQQNKLYLLFKWIIACYMQNNCFLNYNRRTNIKFPTPADDFSDPSRVKGVLAELFVPKSIVYYETVRTMLKENLTVLLEKNLVNIVQEYFHDMFYNIPTIKELYKQMMDLREKYGQENY